MTKISIQIVKKQVLVFWFLSGLVLELPLPMCGRSLEGLSGCLALAFGRNKDLGTAPDGSYGNLGKQTCMSACESIQFLLIFVLRV